MYTSARLILPVMAAASSRAYRLLLGIRQMVEARYSMCERVYLPYLLFHEMVDELVGLYSGVQKTLALTLARSNAINQCIEL